MNYFNYRRGELCCEGVSLASLARAYGTPLYVYSYNTIVHHYERIVESWRPMNVIIAYAMKANSNLAILSIMRKMNSWVDVVSRGEIFRATSAGFKPERMIFGGVGKSREEVEHSIKTGVFMIVADSVDELKLIDKLARKYRRRMKVSIRVNPDIYPATHPYIATAVRESKFGIPIARAPLVFKYANTLPFLDVTGVQQHIGSQIIALTPFLDGLKKLKRLVIALRKTGIRIKYLDIGGGIGIKYKKETPFTLEDYAQTITRIIRDLDCTVILEPGRVIVGNTGVLITKVLYVKKGINRNFVIVDAGMNDLIRPSLYGAYHEIVPLKKTKGSMEADIVGPVCESGDFFARNRRMPKVKSGDHLAVLSAGAYGFSMASNYNSRLRPAEVLVRDHQMYLVRKRESYPDLTRGEISYWF
jgi:diaminopimelate decarboxylase